jgi:hypothetical protein
MLRRSYTECPGIYVYGLKHAVPLMNTETEFGWAGLNVCLSDNLHATEIDNFKEIWYLGVA